MRSRTCGQSLSMTPSTERTGEPVRVRTVLMVVVLSPALPRAGASETSASDSLTVCSAVRNSSGFATDGQCDCAWPLLHVCFGAQLGYRSRSRVLGVCAGVWTALRLRSLHRRSIG